MTTSLPMAHGNGNRRGAARLVHKAARLGRTFAALAVVAALVAMSSCRAGGPSGGQSGAAAQTRPMTEEQVDDAVHVCSACHGTADRNALPDFPRLAGQQKEYIIAQLKAFRDKTRVDPSYASFNMAGMAAHLDDAMIARLARYYAAQHPVAGSAHHPAGVAAGRNIYEQGISDTVLPCMACHGASAQGAGTTPLLAGQDRAYLDQRLEYFATDTRADGVMHLESMHLTTPQRATVSTYLAAQSESRPGVVARQGPITQEEVASTVHVCSSCHEFGGPNVPPVFTFPRLAGQQKDYLIAQLRAFRDKTRADPRARTYMWAVAAHLDDAMITRLADYYSGQNPAPGSAQHPTDVAAGQRIYEHGVPDNVLPCMACHGARAEGAGLTPRLAGQWRLSLKGQLGYFAANTRADGLMHLESVHLTAMQTSDVSAYLAAQSEGKPGAGAQQGPVTQEEVASTVQVCSSCHEFGGPNVPSVFTFPRLAGQQKDYLIAQLRAFRDKTRADPRARAYMWGVATHLNDTMIARLADYYSAQNPAPGSTQDPNEIAAGRIIFEKGIPDKIPPCMACHLANAEGAGTTPRLAGQRRLSLERQLRYFATNKRANKMMHQESMPLTVQQISAISAYLASK